tara:strand:+ start:129 stop:665 length:537 start_codon:yes stop_codon:yes gene_type:complete
MNRGRVYILTNQSMPGLVKIGKTTRSVEQRAAELHQTGVPTPFKVGFDIFTPDCAELELRAHEKFAGVRVSDSREFFAVSVFDVQNYLIDEQRYQVECLVDQFLPDQVIIDCDNFIDSGAFKDSTYQAFADSNLCQPDFASVFYEIEGHEIAPAIARAADKQNRRVEKFRAEREARNP